MSGEQNPGGNQNPEGLTRRNFLKISGAMAGAAVLEAVPGRMFAAGAEENQPLKSNEAEQVEDWSYDGVISSVKNVSSEYIAGLDKDELELEDLQVLAGAWSEILGGSAAKDIKINRKIANVWNAMLGSEMTRGSLEKLFVHDTEKAFLVGGIVKSNAKELQELQSEPMSDDLADWIVDGDVDFRQVVKGEDDNHGTDTSAVAWDESLDKRKYKPIRAVVMNLSNNPIDVEIYRNSGSEALDTMMSLVVGVDKSSWQWNEQTKSFEVQKDGKAKSAINEALGELHSNRADELVGLEEEILGVQEVRQNREVAHGMWEKMKRKVVRGNKFGVYLEDILIEQEVLDDEELMENQDAIVDLMKDYVGLYLNPDYRLSPRYKDVVRMARLASVGNIIAEQVKIIKDGNHVDQSGDYHQPWPRTRERGNVDWEKVDFALVQKRNEGYFYQKGPVEDYDQRQSGENGSVFMPGRALVANWIVGSQTMEQSYNELVRDFLSVMVNTRSDNAWFAKKDGIWNGGFAADAFGNVHTDGHSGERLPSELYGDLVRMEKSDDN